jgi:L-asparaginase II
MLNQRLRDAKGPEADASAIALLQAGHKPSALHNNCSGKHSGFVCLAVHTGEDPKGYTQADHPTMRAVTAAIEGMIGQSLADAPRGIDGCAIPTYGMPLKAVGQGFAKFGTGNGLAPQRAAAARQLRQAAAGSPFHVAGTGRFDTIVMEALGERAFLKTGAEGVYCAALPDQGLGIALKIADGAGRAAECAMAALLARFLPLDDREAAVVLPRATHRLRNWGGTEVGEMRAARALSAG